MLRAWRDALPKDEYGETKTRRAITSHYGRHRFTTWWRVEQDVSEERIKYMGGDAAAADADSRESINQYIHTYYEDIENLYHENIYKLLMK